MNQVSENQTFEFMQVVQLSTFEQVLRAMNSRRWGDGKLSDICGDYRFVHSWHAREIESVETQLLHAVGIEHWTQVLGLQAASHILEDEALHIPRVKAP